MRWHVRASFLKVEGKKLGEVRITDVNNSPSLVKKSSSEMNINDLPGFWSVVHFCSVIYRIGHKKFCFVTCTSEKITILVLHLWVNELKGAVTNDTQDKEMNRHIFCFVYIVYLTPTWCVDVQCAPNSFALSSKSVNRKCNKGSQKL